MIEVSGVWQELDRYIIGSEALLTGHTEFDFEGTLTKDEGFSHVQFIEVYSDLDPNSWLELIPHHSALFSLFQPFFASHSECQSCVKVGSRATCALQRNLCSGWDCLLRLEKVVA